MATNAEKKPIGQLLIEADIITEAQLQEALKTQRTRGGKIVSVLISLGHINLATFMTFLARCRGIASVDLNCLDISPELVQLVPREFAVTHEVFPIDRMGKSMTLCMACPLDTVTIKKLEEMTGLRVWPVLTSPSEIEAAIKRYYKKPAVQEPEPELSEQEELKQAHGVLRTECIISLIKEIASLPPLPETLRFVELAMNDPKSTLADVARRVSVDPAIAAQLLRLINSAAFGLSRRVTNVQTACGLLGLRSIYNLVLAAAATEYFKQWKHVDYQPFWEDSLVCAAATGEIVKRCGAATGESLFSSALLHDIGRLVFSVVTPERYAKLLTCEKQADLIDTERELFQISHTEAGYILARTWNLPDLICDIIRFHHQPWLATEFKKEIAIVALATALFGDGAFANEPNPHLSPNWFETLKFLKIEPEDLPALRKKAIAAYEAERDQAL